MTPTQSKVSAVVLSLFMMLTKQYAVHGRLDPVALVEWVAANWDIVFSFLLVGWTFLRSQWITKAVDS